MNLPYAVPPKQMPSYRDIINLVQLEMIYVQCSSKQYSVVCHGEAGNPGWSKGYSGYMTTRKTDF